MGIEEKRALAKWLVQKGAVPGDLFRAHDGEIEWFHANGACHLPADAAAVLPHSARLSQAVAADLVALCRQKYAGDLVLLGWSPDAEPWTFALERGAHGGPGPNETAGFAILPAKTRLP